MACRQCRDADRFRFRLRQHLVDVLERLDAEIPAGGMRALRVEVAYANQRAQARRSGSLVGGQMLGCGNRTTADDGNSGRVHAIVRS